MKEHKADRRFTDIYAAIEEMQRAQIEWAKKRQE